MTEHSEVPMPSVGGSPGGTETQTWITVGDGVALAVTLYLPSSDNPQPCLLEASPYRKDDVDAGSITGYRRLRDLYGFAVCRLDIRGTGSSGGSAEDEYSVREQQDLYEVINWLSEQDWCDGQVGMWGLSYSGFNALQVACLRPPALKAVCALYATDDRWTDDAHWRGGALRLPSLIGYAGQMAAMNFLPPVPDLWGADWRDEWTGRLETERPWVLTWIRENQDGPYWRNGSVRNAAGNGWERIECPVMLIGGWADGYRNTTFRAVEALRDASVPHRAIFGPWGHEDPATARPGPRVDIEREIVAWWTTWLRGNEADHVDRVHLFVKESTPPSFELDHQQGTWTSWPTSADATEVSRTLHIAEPRELNVRPDVGTFAWSDFAIEIPWGQPSDLRVDNDSSLVWDWSWDEDLAIVGSPHVEATIEFTGARGSVSAKLCDRSPDGSTALISRGFIDLSAERNLMVGQPYRISLQLDACAYRISPGHRLLLAIAGSDWPNTAAAPQPFKLVVHDGTVRLPVAAISEAADDSPLAPSLAQHVVARDDVVCRVVDDRLGDTTTCQVGFTTSGSTPLVQCSSSHSGSVSVDKATFDQDVEAVTTYRLQWAETVVEVSSHLAVRVRRDLYDVDVRVVARDGDLTVGERTWELKVLRDPLAHEGHAGTRT